MRDPDLVQRAEQAATALEQAWIRWRTRHGLGSGPLPPVSSYVGYSVEEPWGQPRVVLGVEASEAERLAAMLDSDDSARTGRPERPGLPEPRRPLELDAAPEMSVPDRELPAGVQPPRQLVSQPGALAASPGQAGSPPESALAGDTGGRPPESALAGDTGGCPPESALAGGTGGRPPESAQSWPAVSAAPESSSAAAATPDELLGRADARLKDLAARVTAMQPRPGTYDEAEPEATESALGNGSVSASRQPVAADSAGRTQVLPAPRLSRARKADDDSAGPAWPADESQVPTADTAV
jgi:hypothetical protein